MTESFIGLRITLTWTSIVDVSVLAVICEVANVILVYVVIGCLGKIFLSFFSVNLVIGLS